MGMLRVGLYVIILGVLYQQAQRFFESKLPVHFGGSTASGWEKVAEIFKEQLEQGVQQGGAFNVYHKGEHVVNIWGGYADPEALVPWNKDTLSMYCSVTKITAALAVQILLDRDLINMKEPVATYWPEFAQQGKHKITVEQLMSHQAGIAYVDSTFSFYDIKNNPKKVGEALAAQVPNWTPGERFGYHAATYALLVDALVERVDPKHRRLSQFFQEEVAEPFGLDFYVGLPLKLNYKAARVHLPSFGWEKCVAPEYWIIDIMGLFANSIIGKIWKNPSELKDILMNNPYAREIPDGSGNGFGTGSSVAKLMGVLANEGEFEGKRLLSLSGIENLNRPLTSGVDETWFLTRGNITYGPGTMIYPNPAGAKTFGHCGLGGQMGYADPSLKLGWSYLTNYFTVHTLGDRPATQELKKAMYECVLALDQN